MANTSANTANTFQSTLSVRRATEQQHEHVAARGISIHALREESDPRPAPWSGFHG